MKSPSPWACSVSVCASAVAQLWGLVVAPHLRDLCDLRPRPQTFRWGHLLAPSCAMDWTPCPLDPFGMACVGAAVRAACSKLLLLTELGAAAWQAGPVPCLAWAPPALCPACPGLWRLLLVLLFDQEPRQHSWLRPKPVGGHGGAWALNTDSGTIICRKPK